MLDVFIHRRETLGADPWPYDLPSNRTALSAMCTYAGQQAQISRLLNPEELFHPGSLDDPPQYVGA
jgi:4,5-dihydroxyphthalate decarboxylase